MEKEYEGKITKFIMLAYGIDSNTKYEILEIEPKQLISRKRLDIIAKLKYIENIEKCLNCTFYNQLYKRHIEAFSNGTYTECGTESKNTIDKYIETFDELIEDIKNNGFNEQKSLIPVGKENSILDGAHRTSTCIYYNKPIKIVKFKDIEVDFDAEFFKKRLLNIEYIEYLVKEYCKLKENTYVFCVWPRAKKKREIEKEILDNTDIIYSKEIELSYNGYRNLMIQIYSKYDWAGNIDNHFNGIYKKLDSCYQKSEKAKIYVVECTSVERILEIKNRIREFLKQGKDSIHSTDDQDETIEMLELLLNKNSIDFLNVANPDKYKEFYKNIKEYRKRIENSGFDIEEFAIDADTVISAYGIKDCKQISFLASNKKYNEIEDKIIKCNNNNYKHYKEKINEIINNPKYYFYFWNVKFVSLELIKRYKKSIHTKEDKEQLAEIDRMLTYKKDLKYRLSLLENDIKRIKRNYKTVIKKHLKSILKKIHIIK